MRTLRLAAVLGLLSAFAASAGAQGADTAHFAIGYDVASDTMTYCRMLGEKNDPWGAEWSSIIRIETSGADTAVTAVTATTAPFAALDVGDAIFVQTSPNTREVRWITAKADDDNVTVNANIDLTGGFAFQYLLLDCGTDAEAGWIRVSARQTLTATVIYAAGDLGALEVVWEGRDNSLVSTAVQAYPGPSSSCGFGTLATNVCSYTTVGDAQAVKVDSNTFAEFRVGLRHDGTDNAVREAVHVILSTRENETQ
jgi:hypothetical protein